MESESTRDASWHATPLYRWTRSALRKRLHWFQRRIDQDKHTSIGSVYQSRGQWHWALLCASASGSSQNLAKAKESLLEAYRQVGFEKLQCALFNPDLLQDSA